MGWLVTLSLDGIQLSLFTYNCGQIRCTGECAQQGGGLAMQLDSGGKSHEAAVYYPDGANKHAFCGNAWAYVLNRRIAPFRGSPHVITKAVQFFAI